MTSPYDHLAGVVATLAQAVQLTDAHVGALVATSKNAQRLRGDRPITVGVGGDVLAWAGAGRLTGWTLTNDAEAAATVTLRDSRDVHGAPVAVVRVPAGGAVSFSHAAGVSFGEGLFVDVAGAPVAGVVWIGAET
jgi:hypothetical protein